MSDTDTSASPNIPEADHRKDTLRSTERVEADAAGRQQDFLLGDWRVRPSLNRIERGSDAIRLEPRLVNLLVFLASKPKRVASKEEIFDAVWKAPFVADSTLTRCVADLRRALGDDAQTPNYIETIPKRGYRLVAPVRPLGGTTAGGGRSPDGEGARRLAFGLTLLVLLTLLSVMVVVSALKHPSLLGRDVEIRSVAVLPLEDHSQNKDDYFADSMSEALTTDLARLGSLRVLSRRSVEGYRGRQASLAQIAEELGVDAVVDGSILRDDTKVRISVQLTDTKSEEHLWAGSYERVLSDVLALQRDVTSAIVDELHAEVASTPRPVRRVDATAHDLYLQARHSLKYCSTLGPNETEELLRRALAIDSSFAPAYAALGEYFEQLAEFDFLPPHVGFPKARTFALRALEIDPELAAAHAVLASVQFEFDWDWARAEQRFLKALDLNASDSRSLYRYSVFLTTMARFEESLAKAELLRKVEPLHGPYHHAWVLFHARRYDESIEVLEASPESQKDRPSLLAWNYALSGRTSEAVDLLEQVLADEEKPRSVTLGVLGWAQAVGGRIEEAWATLRLLEGGESAGGDLYLQVLVLAGLGEVDRAIDLLEDVLVRRSPNVIFLRVEPFLDPLRSDPRFARLVERIRLPGFVERAGEPSS